MKLKKGLSVLLLLAFLVSTALLLRNVYAIRSGADAYSDAKALAAASLQTEQLLETTQATAPSLPELPETVWVPAQTEEPDPVMEELAQLDLAALQAENPDVLGWIRIPDTKIDYPLVQGEDNDFYLNNNWQGKKSYLGSIFLEHRSSPDFTDYNTIVYGHNMTNGSMFAGLHKYKYDGYWQEHPYVYVLTGAGVLRYEVFSAYTAEVDSDTYRLSFSGKESKADFLVMALENSEIDTGIAPELMDRILTLSTCSGMGYSTRRVVHARLKMVEVTLDG